ncbi:hypothetical protein AK812_SmicGene2193 [Symbiodinium microadriaticum]|uniref:Uncharacterized protein n=1 Tax=Symbiodinium microadriaticum TaxID=2951 RepID=A0A1Q9F241_SYMMI|nr:hypothetical protein AK812_SmicGene2193 [Symbiodinium microadriaticum]
MRPIYHRFVRGQLVPVHERTQRASANRAFSPASRSTKDYQWAAANWEANPEAPAWADDFFLPRTGQDKLNILDCIQRTVGHALGLSSAIDMRLTFAAKGKTAVLLPSSYDWSATAGLSTQTDG